MLHFGLCSSTAPSASSGAYARRSGEHGAPSSCVSTSKETFDRCVKSAANLASLRRREELRRASRYGILAHSFTRAIAETRRRGLPRRTRAAETTQRSRQSSRRSKPRACAAAASSRRSTYVRLAGELARQRHAKRRRPQLPQQAGAWWQASRVQRCMQRAASPRALRATCEGTGTLIAATAREARKRLRRWSIACRRPRGGSPSREHVLACPCGGRAMVKPTSRTSKVGALPS
jgi:hypothetical protein